MRSDIKQIMNKNMALRIISSIPWIIGPIMYAVGLIIAIVTGNLTRFIGDYPWACLTLVITIAIWSSPKLIERHWKYTIMIRDVLKITDEEFNALLEKNIRRLFSGRNVIFGLAFLPGLLWAFTQRLWWREYSHPALFDFYYLVTLVFVLLYYASIMFGAAVSCNQNLYTICENTPINSETLLDVGQPIFKRFWGGQILRITTLALIMSALTNVPVLLYSGSTGFLLNLVIALTLTVFIFVVPHVMFHRMLERAKEEVLEHVSQRRRSLRNNVRFGSVIEDAENVGRMLDIIYLTQYEGVLENRGTWLVNLEVIMELLVVGSLHVTFMEILNILMHH